MRVAPTAVILRPDCAGLRLSSMASQGESMLRLAPICAALILAGSAGLAAAQQPTLGTAAPNVKRSTLHKIEVPGSNYDVTFALVDVGANTRLGRHAHPGTVPGYVLEGEYTIAVD